MTRMTMAALPIVEETDGRSNKFVNYPTREGQTGGLTHCYDIASHCIAEGEIPSDSDKHIEESRNTYASDNHSRGSEMRIIAYLIQN